MNTVIQSGKGTLPMQGGIITPPGGASPPTDAELRMMPAPAHASTLRWQLAGVQERRELLGGGEGFGGSAGGDGDEVSSSALPGGAGGSRGADTGSVTAWRPDSQISGAAEPAARPDAGKTWRSDEIATLSPADLQARNQAMMAALQPYVESGDYTGFWRSAAQFGEPLAELALDFHDGLYGASMGTDYAIRKLEGAEAARLLSEGGRPGEGNLEARGSGRNRTIGLTPEALGALKEKVGAGVMKAHYEALDRDIRNIDGEGGKTPGVLSYRQIQEYHEDYFEKIGLPRNTYGGSVDLVGDDMLDGGRIDGAIEWLMANTPGLGYCNDCDPKE